MNVLCLVLMLPILHLPRDKYISLPPALQNFLRLSLGGHKRYFIVEYKQLPIHYPLSWTPNPLGIPEMLNRSYLVSQPLSPDSAFLKCYI